MKEFAAGRLIAVRTGKDGNTNVWWVEVEPYEPPSTCVEEARSARLKQLFADYAAKDTSYQSRIKFHRFYAERVASLKKPKELGWFVAQAITLFLI